MGWSRLGAWNAATLQKIAHQRAIVGLEALDRLIPFVRLCVREGIAVKTVWPGLAIHTDSPMSAARIAEVLVEHQRSNLCVKVPKSLAR
jgi:hypothetical protein